ncbi:S-layer homology domain-containing protein [Paenibacillus sp. cl141a]|uniref:S-layer homology domain-containing protein n=1 Tax=Paenibacillus sp. cl141a TaxID=1761877 RepID=UPI0008D36ACE|nr:S-layer homology domain-containing protein [Paenibacillus sp. cl141a]SEL31557.1 S-layer homology domain-containing protein [Paenibacillus sp. cl141a]
MSDKSYQIKENNQVMIQGGEKKVMKKILSVALSTAMAFSMFASVAFGDDALNTQQKFDVLKEKGIFTGYPDGTAGLDKEMTRAEFAKVLVGIMGLEPIQGKASFKDKNYKADKWPAPYVEAVYAAGIMEGKNTTKMIFDFNGKITVQEMAKVLVVAQKLDIPTETNNNASDWAKGYVQAAINAGLVDAKTNPKANASRSQLVEVAYTIYLSQQKPKVVSYDVTESGKVVTFKLANNESVKVELETPLKANTATEVKFTHNNYEYTESVTWTVTSATKVESASAKNLKEVEVVFDGKVDKVTATDKNNYVIDSNSKGIKSITLLADGKTARILLNESSKFTQGTTYKAIVKNVKNDSGTVLPQGELSFTVSDNTLPAVTEVKALGTKVIKVTFSEPIVSPSSSNFQLDDKAFVGNVKLGPDQREVILRDYTGNISVGTHKLTTSLIEDYAGLKSPADTKEFTVAVDSEGPKVTEVSATLEKVTVTFDEEIDPDTVTNDSFYWKSGDSKKTGKVTQISSNVYEIDFTENRLPGYETTLFVEVKDYSGNANPVKEHKITASVDLVQPHVVETSFGADRPNTLTVRFDKAVYAADKKYYTVKKGNDTIPVKDVVAADASNKIFYVNFFSKLDYGTYDLTVKDVKDRTALGNTVVEYKGTFVANDTANPMISSVDYNNTNRKLTLNFGREMDLADLQTRGNYFIAFKKNGYTDAQNIAIPADVTVNPVNGGKSVVLQFPEYIDGTRVTFGPGGSVSKVWTTGLKSKTGQYVSLDNQVLTEAGASLKWVGATQKDAKTFELTFNHVIANASTGDFLVNGQYPSSVSISDGVVTLKTSSEFNGGDITIFANNSIETYSNNKLNLTTNATMPVNNAAAPRVVKVDDTRKNGVNATGAVYNSFEVTFSVDVEAADYADVKNDIILKNVGKTNSPVINKAGYTVERVSDRVIRVDIYDPEALNNPVQFQIADNASYLYATNSSPRVYVTKSSEYQIAPPAQSTDSVSVTGTKVTVADKGALAQTADQNGLKFVAKSVGTGLNGNSVVITKNAAQTDKVKVNGLNITVNNDATVSDIIAAVLTADVNYEAQKGSTTGSIADSASYEFNGGKAVVEGQLTVNLNNTVTKVVDGKVIIAGKEYSATANNSNTIVVTTGDADVVGEQLIGKVEYKGKEQAISVQIAK